MILQPNPLACISDNLTSNSSVSKTRRKQMKSKNRNKLNLNEEMIHYYRGIKHLAEAMHRVIVAFSIEGKISQPSQSLTTEEVRYNHRFLPLLQFEGSVQSFRSYRERFGSGNAGQLYREAFQAFERARDQFEAIKSQSYQEEVSAGSACCPDDPFGSMNGPFQSNPCFLDFYLQIQPYIKVARTNNIVIKLLLSGHNANANIGLIFDETPYFPIIRFQ